MNSAELKDRTKQFALRCLKLVNKLPARADGRALAHQLARSSMAVGANYRAACRSRSRAEFAARMGVVLEEADETAYWLELVVASGMMSASLVADLLDEAQQLTAIFARSCKTARRIEQAPAAGRKALQSPQHSD